MSLFSEPLILDASVPLENSIALAPGIAMSALARDGSSPSNHGSPTPMGSPRINNSTTEPIESFSLRIFLIDSPILTAASGSLQFSLDISVPSSSALEVSR